MRATLGVLAATAALAIVAAPAHAAPLAGNGCPLTVSGAPCVGLDKLAERLSAECRRVGRPADDCQLPLGHRVGGDIAAKYRTSWLHRAAAFQYALGDTVPLGDAQWLGTHNSFNSVSDEPTLSKTDSNQQLTLSEQLDIDVRALELDVHWAPNLHAGAANDVLVCHGRGPDEQDFGCTNERPFSQVLPQIANWLNAHGHEVLLLYVEDELGDAKGYAETVKVLDTVLRRPGGSTLIYRPSPSEMTAKGCANLPLGISRDDVRLRGAQVVLVGNCRSGWASDVYGWDDVHVESGSTPNYKGFPTCDATYPRSVYDTKLVRYYEDSTFVSSAIDPTQSPQAAAAEMLSPQKTAAMTRCGVNLFGFDQLLPDDGRIAATIWSWDTDKPNAADGRCAFQRRSGRWASAPCASAHKAACRIGGVWKITGSRYSHNDANQACRKRGGALGLPRTGYDNALLRRAAGPTVQPWLGYRVPG